MRVIAQPAFKNAASNPYNALLYSAIREHGIEVAEFSKAGLRSHHWDVWHTHWPQWLLKKENALQLWRSVRKQMRLIDLVRARGTKVVWTIHNLQPHEQKYPRLERAFWTGLTARLDAFISLSETGLALARDHYPALADKPGVVIPHGHYRDIYPHLLDRGEARRKLAVEPDASVVANLGQIRPYKNVPHLIRVFRDCADAKAVLLICGRPLDPGVEREVRAAANGDPRVRLALGYIPDDQIQLYLKAADLLVFPYAEVLNSGCALLGLSFDRPVLVPNLGAMAELRERVGASWMQMYDGALDSRTLEQALVWAQCADRGAQPDLDRFDWRTIGHQTIEVYRELCRAAAPRDRTAAGPDWQLG